MRNAIIVTGSITDDHTLRLDEALPVHTGKVRVLVELLDTSAKMSHEEFAAWLEQHHRTHGHVPRTREEVDASLKAERASWDF